MCDVHNSSSLMQFSFCFLVSYINPVVRVEAMAKYFRQLGAEIKLAFSLKIAQLAEAELWRLLQLKFCLVTCFRWETAYTTWSLYLCYKTLQSVLSSVHLGLCSAAPFNANLPKMPICSSHHPFMPATPA